MSEASYLKADMPDTIILNGVHDDLPMDAALIDLDSCLLDFFGSFLPILNEYTGKEFTEQDFYVFDIDKVAGISVSEVMMLLSETKYMLEMKPFARTVEFLNSCRQKGLRTVLSTSRVFAKHCTDHTLKNLQTLGLVFDELHLVRGNKWETKYIPDIRYVLYFDDSPSHIGNYFSAKERGDEVPLMMCAPILPYNKHFHETRNDLKYLDLRDESIDFATLIPQC